MDIDSLIDEANNTFNECDELLLNLNNAHTEIKRVHQIAVNTEQILTDLDREFELKTGLTSFDSKFLFLATGMQMARQYILSNEKYRLTANQGDKLIKDTLAVVAPDWKDILTQSVPYDMYGPKELATGLSGTTHRYRTLGHDPLLGWVFGTANIMTSSLTKYDFVTYTVDMSKSKIVSYYPLGVGNMLNNAMLYAQKEPKLLAVSVARQAIHFSSDYFTKQGLPVPFIATVNNNLAKNMITDWNVDMYSITRSVTLSAFINQLISIMHQMFNNNVNTMDRKLYEVRTRKIISMSNVIASSSNALLVAAAKDMKNLDVGGCAVTIFELIRNRKFIQQVKEEFVYGNYYEMIRGEF